MTHLIADLPASYSIGAQVRLSLLTLCFVMLLSACAEPFIVMSGGELSGEVADPPVDWTELNEVDIVQLETRPDDPYSVNIWMVGIGPDIYIATGEDDTRWTLHLADDRDVRLRVGQSIYELRATPVTDSEEKLAVGRAYVAKYDLDEDDNWVQHGQAFRLDRR